MGHAIIILIQTKEKSMKLSGDFALQEINGGKIMLKKIKHLSLIIGVFLALGITVLADDAIKLMETHTNTENISLYVKGITQEDEVQAQIATGQADSVEMATLSNLDMPMQTLIMIDNSLSIPEKDRNTVSEIVQNVISDRMANEQIAISTFSEDINMLTDYTNDYPTLKKALDSVTYQNQETYLTDVLYDLISNEYVNATEDVYRRILVISDGVDNKSIGYTKEELSSLLKEYPIPIYTIGCSTGKNNTELENMFAISRSTSADYYLIDDIDDILDITESLNQDREIVKITVNLPEELMDGGKKTVKITTASGTSFSTDMAMPQKAKAEVESVVESTVEEETEVEEDTETEEERPQEIKSDNNTLKLIIILAIALIVVVVAIVVVVIIILSKKKNKNKGFEHIDEELLNNQISRNNSVPYGVTELVDIPGSSHDDGNTFAIFEQSATYQLVLTDINSPAKTFHVPLNNSVVVGRRVDLCNLVIEYDRSVSGRHCEIVARDGRFFVNDLQSKNGTYINNSKIVSETEIFSGNILRLGMLEMRFDVR
jgi:hypothetical protein